MLVAFAGVIVSVAGGAAVYLVFGFGDGDLAMLEAVFMGTILAATSVSITVQALKEMGHLKGRVATTILSAAIIDDVIGIVLLTVVIGFKSPDVQPASVCINICTRLCTLFSLQVARQALAALKKNSDFRPCSLLCVCILCGRIFRNCRHHRRICCRYYPL